MRLDRRLGWLTICGLYGTLAPASRAQGTPPVFRPVSRAEAVAAALSSGARVAIALTDTSAAKAVLASALAFPNPALLAGYSKSTPQFHLSLDQPVEYPWLRSARADAAKELVAAARYRFTLERAAAEIEADTVYTAALAARAHARLSQRSAIDADSLLTLARLRRDAGDASELEVELAAVNAGQAANASASDSLAALALLLELQRVMGLPADLPLITPTDSLAPPDGVAPSGDRPAPTVAPLAVAAAEAAMRGAEHGLVVQQRSVFNTPSIQFGFDTHDPTGAEPGMLPTVAISVPLPLWNQHGGEVALAQAGVARAQAELARARRESALQIARTRREFDAAMARVVRAGRLLASAKRVAEMALTAYSEGAATLATVLEAQRAARDAVAHYVDDVAAAQTAAALLRLHTLTAPSP